MRFVAGLERRLRGDRDEARLRSAMRAQAVFATCLGLLACNSASYGTPQDCLAAGGHCMLPGPGNGCPTQGPKNTCNCNAACNPGGAICCLPSERSDGAVPDSGLDAPESDAGED